MPNSHPIAEVNYKEAQALRDIHSILRDIEMLIESLNTLKFSPQNDKEENAQTRAIQQALWTTSLIAYVRCFTTGKRFGLGEDIFDGKENAVKMHRYFKNMRDKHIAHSVNPFEQTKVGLILSPKNGEERKVEAVCVLSFSNTIDGEDGVNNLLILASMIRKKLQQMFSDQKAEVLVIGQNLPINELYEMADKYPYAIRAPGIDDANKPRT
jgi:hypothetical protein